MENRYFLNMIRTLRKGEEVVLYNNMIEIGITETTEVVHFLQREYFKEAVNFPFGKLDFDYHSALWAAKTVYYAAQLILFREQIVEEIEELFQPFEGNIDSKTIVSADLCLRFLPDMINQLKLIDAEDRLIGILEELLIHWHFSAVNYEFKIALDFKDWFQDKTIQQLYVNRIIDLKKIKLAILPECKDLVSASLGMYKHEIWNEFKMVLDSHERN